MESLRVLRVRKKMSQQKIAKLLEISQQYYSKIETGAATPSPDVGQRIAHIYGLTIEEMWHRFYGTSNHLQGGPADEPSAANAV